MSVAEFRKKWAYKQVEKNAKKECYADGGGCLFCTPSAAIESIHHEPTVLDMVNELGRPPTLEEWEWLHSQTDVRPNTLPAHIVQFKLIPVCNSCHVLIHKTQDTEDGPPTLPKIRKRGTFKKRRKKLKTFLVKN
jgi:hypothetical protein